MSDKLNVTVDAQVAALVPRFLGHRMKGAGGGYGFAEISRLGAALEEAALQRDAAAIAGLVANLEAYLGRIEIRFSDEQ